MFKNYFLTAIRNLFRNRLYSFISIFGLAIGMAVTLIVFRFIQFEKSYDKYHKDYQRIYRVYRTVTHPEIGTWNDARIGGAFYNIATQNLSSVENATRIIYTGDYYIRHSNEDFKESKLIFADSTFFNVFDFPLLTGDPKTALIEPNTIVITEAIAKKYFGDEPAIGKTIGELNPLKVTGILKDIPDNSHFRFSIVASMGTFKNFFYGKNADENLNSWQGEIFTYIKLRKGIDEAAFSKSIGHTFVGKYVNPYDYKDYSLHIEPLEQLHLNSKCEYYIGGDLGLRGTSQGLLYVFSILGVLVLIIACINFTNISISSSLPRSKEVALRKVTGAKRFQLILQFIGEYIIITFLALCLAILLIEFILPLLGNIIGRKITINYFHNFQFIVASLIVVLTVGIFSGIYPSFVLSAFSPSKALKNELKINKGGFLKKMLIVLQFTVSIILIIVAVFSKTQINNWTSKEMGFLKENVLVLPINSNTVKEKFNTFKDQLLASPDISGVTTASINFSLNEPPKYYLNLDEIKEQPIQVMSADYDFINTMGIELIKGRNFSNENITDEMNSFIIDETAAKYLKLKDPLDKQIELLSKKDNTFLPYTKGKIIGVVKNFSYLPGFKRRQQKGLIINMDKNFSHYMFIRVRDSRLKAATTFIKEKYNALFPRQFFVISNLEDDIDNNFVMKMIKRTMFFFTVAPILATIIALMGIFALVLQSAERRTKEVAIRKIYGTPIRNLIMLQTKEYSVLIVIANLIAFCISYTILNKMLKMDSGFEAPSLLTYLIVALSTYLVGMLTVVSLIITSTRKNPVEALRYE
jgi:putative ABC transport system permease protein